MTTSRPDASTSVSCRIALAPKRELEPDDIKTETRDCISEQVSVATGANQSRSATIRKKTLQHERENQQSIMPEGADVILIHRFSKYACAIFDFITQRAHPKLQEAKSDRDQPARGSTFDLQGLREGFAASSPQR